MEIKIALIHARVSNNNVPPLGLLSIAGFLEEKKIEVRVWDPSLYDKDFIAEVREFNPDIIGISLMTAQYGRAKEIIYLLRDKIPQAIYICGGSHVSALPEESLKGLNADVAVVGEGELTMYEFCCRYNEDCDWQELRGISYLSEGKVISNQRRELIDNLDTLPFTGRELLSTSFNWYLIPPGAIRGMFAPRTTTMMTSRGCPYNCVFCASQIIFGHHFRRRSVNNVIEEICYLQKRYGVEGIWFLDDTFTFDRDWVRRFCSALIRQGLNPIWSCQTRVDTLDIELLRQMKLAGCVQVEIGVESGSDKVLKALSKNICSDDFEEKFTQMKQLGLRVMTNFMIGSPEEEVADIRATYQLAKRLKPDFIKFNVCTPYPGSRLYQIAQRKGWLVEDQINFNSNWSEQFTRVPVMHINIDPLYLLKLRARLQNRFLWRNYGNIIKGFLHSSVHSFQVVKAIFFYLKENYRSFLGFLKEGKFDAIIWEFYSYYSRMTRDSSHP
ncbi:B12-binding domain-containing radical SAM protein [Patescibacteria group bacterium]|nr:B12-binding domain-containing radical SAM protein [Patescibacteria group bacterium]MBU1524676.1 B12-binding domain-containing radical SAM protein [Candidatus Omnitrophota bacterium]MBU2504500.1 B12-binding domain-containing radical SAM protein [Candidatus Omnitrophota bacterium]